MTAHAIAMGMRPSAAGVVALLLISAVLVAGISLGDGPPRFSLTTQVTDGGVNNAVRVGSTNLMYYPRIVADRDPNSPRFGTIYVIGLSDLACASVVVSASTDGGLTFGGPTTFDACGPGPS